VEEVRQNRSWERSEDVVTTCNKDFASCFLLLLFTLVRLEVGLCGVLLLCIGCDLQLCLLQ